MSVFEESVKMSQEQENGLTSNVTVLVTGGAGYIGTHTIVQLLSADFEVVVVDNLMSLNLKNNGHIKPENLRRVEKIMNKTVTFYNSNLLDAEATRNIFNLHRIDCVLHLAALKSVGESCQKPIEYYRNNVIGTINLLEVMKECSVKNIVFSSSATVYGTPKYLPIDENHVTGQGCTNPYGKTKYFIEEILRDICTSDSEWNAVCLRYFNPVGAHPSGQLGEDPNGVPCNLMPYVTQVAVGRRPELLVFGNDYDTPDGTGVRDYIHIMDLAEGHVAATRKILHVKATGWQAYNLGMGKGYSVLEMVACLESISGKKIPMSFVGRRDGDVAACYSDCSLAAAELGWKARFTLVEMCKSRR